MSIILSHLEKKWNLNQNMCPEKKHLLSDISLSNQTVMRRAELMSEDLK